MQFLISQKYTMLSTQRFKYNVKSYLLPVKKVFFEYWDIIFCIYLLISLNEYLTYYTKISEGKQDTDWSWPLYANSLVKDNLLKPHQKDGSLASLSQYKNPTSSQDYDVELKRSKLSKLIVFYHPAFDEEKPYPLEEKTCGVKCQVSYDVKLQDRADAVIFHFRDVPTKKLPKRRYLNNIVVSVVKSQV